MPLARDNPPVVLIGEWMGVTSNGSGRKAPKDLASEVRDGVLIVVIAGRQPVAGVMANVIRVLERWVTSASFEPPLRAFVDVSDSGFDPSGSEVRSAAIRLGYLGEGKLALLVSSDLQFGLARMLGIVAQGTGIEVRPFRREADALEWVART